MAIGQSVDGWALGDSHLGYNALYGGGTFTDKTYEEAPKDYKDHPQKKVIK